MDDLVQMVGTGSGTEMRVRIPRGIRPVVAAALTFEVKGQAFVAMGRTQ
jgi:hypothetical protein